MKIIIRLGSGHSKGKIPLSEEQPVLPTSDSENSNSEPRVVVEFKKSREKAIENYIKAWEKMVKSYEEVFGKDR